jgi:signal recognition particle subunit SRP72
LYKDLGNDGDHAESEVNDLKINDSAIDSQLEWKGLGHLAQSRKASKDDMAGFERAFNAACGSIARGELRQAGVLLKRSQRKS